MNGVIKKIVVGKPFGFIAVDGQADVFFHESALVDVAFGDLHEGDKVTFDMGQSDKGANALNVKRV